jgi:uncharacterized protein with PQ loop repeat
VIFGIVALTDMEIIDGLKLQTFLSFICPLFTMTQFASPTPVVLEAIRKSDVQNLPTPVFISQAACNILGSAYGIRVRNVAVLASNMFGLFCQTVFLASNHFVRKANGQWIRHTLQLQAIYCAALYVCVDVFTLNVLGQIITLFNIVLFSVPLASLGTILKTKNCASLPTAMTIVSTLSNGVWSVYASLIKDMVVLLPSILGFALCFFQVLVLLWCHSKLPFDLSFLLLPCRSSPSKKMIPDVEARGFSENWENPEITGNVIRADNVLDSDI